MKTLGELLTGIRGGAYDDTFATLYPASAAKDCRARYIGLIGLFIRDCGKNESTRAVLVSAPGRTEIGGNHTDHQHGNVLTASVNLDTICVAAPNGSDVIRVRSVGYPVTEINIGELEKRESELGNADALVRGVANWFNEHDVNIIGFDAYTTTDVMVGSGLSSSAAFEVVIGKTIDVLCDANRSAAELAYAGQYAENVYFGKPCGLLDQMSSSVGGLLQVDFNEPKHPTLYPIACDIKSFGLNLCVVDTKGNHADLTADYAAITQEMRAVANCFDKGFLREVDETSFFSALPKIRELTGDRAVLRAIHYYRDNALAIKSADALRANDIDTFLSNIISSGRSSFTCLQNVFSTSDPSSQGLSLALNICERILEGKGGAWRVHGGGFAGTILAFVPNTLLDEFRASQNSVFGENACHFISIRPIGAVEIQTNITDYVSSQQ